MLCFEKLRRKIPFYRKHVNISAGILTRFIKRKLSPQLIMKYQTAGSPKLHFYTCYRLLYYIAGIPCAVAWYSSLWSAGMAIMPMYIYV